MELNFPTFSSIERYTPAVLCSEDCNDILREKWQLCQNLSLFYPTQRTKPPRLPIGSSSRYLEVNACSRNLDGQAGSHARVDHRRGMGHDAATLQVSEAVHERTHGPFHTCGHGEGDEAQSWAQNPAAAGISKGAALEAQWHKWAARWVG